MARIRSIKPVACRSRKLAALTDGGERLWWRMQVHADDEGRLEDDPEMIGHDAVPLLGWSPDLVDALLGEMAEVGLIQRYHHGERPLIQVVNFTAYQKPNRRTPSEWPAPNGTRPHDMKAEQ